MPVIFAEKLLKWVDQNSSVGLLDELCERCFKSRANYPEKIQLWKNYIREVVPAEFQHIYYKHSHLFDPLLTELNQLPNFPQVSNIQNIFENKMPGWAVYAHKTTFCEKVIKFHSEIPKWLDGSIHARYQKDKIQLLLLIQEQFLFFDLWSCARFLTNNGLHYPTSKKAYECWEKYSSNKFIENSAVLEWFEVLTQMGSSWDQMLLVDKKLDLILDSSLTFGLPSLCQDGSSCGSCPLSSNCHFYNDHYSNEHQIQIENLIKLKRSEEIKKVDMLAFLAGDRCQYTRSEIELLNTFPVLPPGNTLSEKNRKLEVLKIFLQGLIELFHKTKFDTYKPKGDSFTDSGRIAKYVYHLLSRENQEFFYTLILDNKNRVIRNHRVSQGLLNKSLVHPREVFAPALELRAASIVLIHNHPSGDTTPSIQDRNITKRLTEVGRLVGINVIDHLIIGDETYFSFVDQGIMPSAV